MIYRSFKISFSLKLMILVIILVSMVETISAKTIESKGRINWERLNLEEKKINLENRRLQFEIIKLQMEACKDVYATDTQARTSCAKKYMLQLSDVFEK